MAEELTTLNALDPELVMLQNNKTSGFEYRKRRDDDWLENYTLYRDNVVVNRLTQRQSVNLPLMKTVLRTLIKDVDDMPVLYFENLDNDKEAETFKNEYWKVTEEENKFEILDIIDKRQVFQFGRSYDQWQIIDGKVVMTIIDPQDILVSRFVDPHNIHSSRFLIHTHIFTPLAVIEANKDYDQEKVKQLKEYHASEQGLIKAKENEEMLIEKNKKLEQMGVTDLQNPVLGETYIELTMHFVFRKEEGDEDEQIYLYVEADGQVILMKKTLESIIGVTSDHFWRNHYPYNSWADDVEKQDWYSDGVADIVRPANKVLNAWYSQLVENRTLKSFGMNIYNSSLEGFQPQTWEPRPWGWYGMPVPEGKNLSDVYQRVDIPDLSDSLDDMNFITGMVEKATGATSTQQGAQTERSITLGEVQLALGEAKERIKGMSKFYTQVWKERGLLFTKLVEASHDKLNAVTIYKKGRQTDNIYSREISPKDWMTASGYKCKVWSQEEKSQQDTKKLEKLNAVVANMPGNPKLMEVYQRKLLEFADLRPDEINDIMVYEEQKRMAMMAGNMLGMDGMPVVPQAGTTQPMPRPGMQPIQTQIK